jgi:nucleotide sugar dehydrogenase
MKMTIVGHGFVGKAVDYGFSSSEVEKTIIDPLYNVSLTDVELEEDVTFVCVPTPMGKDGEIDCSIVVNTVKQLLQRRSGIIVIKSTVTPDIVEKLTKRGSGSRVVYNPEFLTEKNACEDFVNPSMHIFGGKKETTKRLEEIYINYSICKPCPIYHMSATDASFVKYGINCFLASKVLWMNQFYDVIKDFGGNYGLISNAIGTDPRIGRSHISVPGFDGKRGFGGACFPKDTAAFANFAKSFSVLEKVIEENNNYRKDYEKDERELAQNVVYS